MASTSVRRLLWIARIVASITPLSIVGGVAAEGLVFVAQDSLWPLLRLALLERLQLHLVVEATQSVHLELTLLEGSLRRGRLLLSYLHVFERCLQPGQVIIFGL